MFVAGKKCLRVWGINCVQVCCRHIGWIFLARSNQSFRFYWQAIRKAGSGLGMAPIQNVLFDILFVSKPIFCTGYCPHIMPGATFNSEQVLAHVERFGHPKP